MYKSHFLRVRIVFLGFPLPLAFGFAGALFGLGSGGWLDPGALPPLPLFLA